MIDWLTVIINTNSTCYYFYKCMATLLSVDALGTTLGGAVLRTRETLLIARLTVGAFGLRRACALIDYVVRVDGVLVVAFWSC